MKTTLDSIWRNDVRILQPRTGYRFAIDSVLLAHFLRIQSNEDCLEIGAGAGVISILLSRLQQYRSLTAVEIQPELAELCRLNFQQNKLQNARVVEGDITALEPQLPPHSFDLVFSNPPYRVQGSGKLNPSSQKAIARHEIKMKLKDLFHCAETLLSGKGRMSVVIPEFRKGDFDRLIEAHQFHYHEDRAVHSFAMHPPAFHLATVGRNQGTRVTHPPLVIYDSVGKYSKEMAHMLVC